MKNYSCPAVHGIVSFVIGAWLHTRIIADRGTARNQNFFVLLERVDCLHSVAAWQQMHPKPECFRILDRRDAMPLLNRYSETAKHTHLHSMA